MNHIVGQQRTRMSKAVSTDPRPVESEHEDAARTPTNDDGHYICFRECDDGSPCQRVLNVPSMACYDHFGRPPMRQSADEE